MAVIEKTYPYKPEFLLNAIYDIQEMRKARVMKSPSREGTPIEVKLLTEMYGIEKLYIFRLMGNESSTVVEIESNDSSNNPEQSVQLMLTILDGIIEPFRS